MIGLLCFLLCVLIVVLIVKAICAEMFPGNGNIMKIAMLVICLFAILWLAGFGGWGHVYGWRP